MNNASVRVSNSTGRLMAAACVLLAAGIVADYRLSPVHPQFASDWKEFSGCMERATTLTCTVTVAPNWVLTTAPTGR